MRIQQHTNEELALAEKLANTPVVELYEKLLAQYTRITELEALSERLKNEAQIHAMEAKTANTTINEIYQLITGATGEPATWNGAKPVKEFIESMKAQLADAKQVANDCRIVADNAIAEAQAALKDAERYQWLRTRDLDTVNVGGVFAGEVPQNNVLNGIDLDAAIDAAMQKETK